jgi:hypothetical protein
MRRKVKTELTAWLSATAVLFLFLIWLNLLGR